MNDNILYNIDQIIGKVSFADEYIRAFLKARDTFARYWCSVRGWGVLELSPDQILEIQNHPDWIKPSVVILPPGQLTIDDEQKLRMYSAGCKLAVELGTLFGRGAAVLSEVTKQVITVDNYYDPNYGGLYHTVETVTHRLSGYRNIIVVNSDTSNPDTVEDYSRYGKVDILFVDGDHTYDGTRKDFEAWYNSLQSGAYVLFHDSVNIDTHPGVVQYVNDLIARKFDYAIGLDFVERADGAGGSITVMRRV